MFCLAGCLERWYAKRKAAVGWGESVVKKGGGAETRRDEQVLETVLRRPGDEGRLVEAFSDK